MESSQRDIFIYVIVDWFIFKNNQSTLSLCFTCEPKTGVGLPKTGVSFYCAYCSAVLTGTANKAVSDLMIDYTSKTKLPFWGMLYLFWI